MANAGNISSLNFRHELKYYINYHDYVVLKNALSHLMYRDPHAGKNGIYYIRSLYFDDYWNTALGDKMSGTDHRSKFRIRIYDFSDRFIRFEKKIKEGQFIAKKSFMLSSEELDSIFRKDYAFLLSREEPLAREVYTELTSRKLEPKVFVDYRREPFVLPYENVRITFDMDLKSGIVSGSMFDSDLPLIPVFGKGIMVLEVKFDRYLPDYICRILENAVGATRSAVSKYVLCRQYETNI